MGEDRDKERNDKGNILFFNIYLHLLAGLMA